MPYNAPETFYVDDVQVDITEYAQHLETVGIYGGRRRNYMTDQGQTAQLALLTPAERTTYIDLLSGSGALADEYKASKARFTAVSWVLEHNCTSNPRLQVENQHRTLHEEWKSAKDVERAAKRTQKHGKDYEAKRVKMQDAVTMFALANLFENEQAVKRVEEELDHAAIQRTEVSWALIILNPTVIFQLEELQQQKKAELSQAQQIKHQIAHDINNYEKRFKDTEKRGMQEAMARTAKVVVDRTEAMCKKAQQQLTQRQKEKENNDKMIDELTKKLA